MVREFEKTEKETLTLNTGKNRIGLQSTKVKSEDRKLLFLKLSLCASMHATKYSKGTTDNLTFHSGRFCFELR